MAMMTPTITMIMMLMTVMLMTVMVMMVVMMISFDLVLPVKGPRQTGQPLIVG